MKAMAYAGVARQCASPYRIVTLTARQAAAGHGGEAEAGGEKSCWRKGEPAGQAGLGGRGRREDNAVSTTFLRHCAEQPASRDFVWRSMFLCSCHLRRASYARAPPVS